MKLFHQIFRQNWIVIALLAAVAGTFLGLGYWLGQRSLQQQINALTAQISHQSPLSVSSWAGTNSGRPMQPFLPGANISANASPEMKEFLENRAKLMTSFAQMRSQSTNGAPNPQAFAQFQQQNAALLQRQRELSQIISQQQAKNPMPTPPPLQMPPNASPQLQSFLTARDQLMRDQVTFMNQHRTDAPATRQAAMQQWRQQNAARFTQLQQLSQALMQSKPATPAMPITPTSIIK